MQVRAVAGQDHEDAQDCAGDPQDAPREKGPLDEAVGEDQFRASVIEGWFKEQMTKGAETSLETMKTSARGLRPWHTKQLDQLVNGRYLTLRAHTWSYERASVDSSTNDELNALEKLIEIAFNDADPVNVTGTGVFTNHTRQSWEKTASTLNGAPFPPMLRVSDSIRTVVSRSSSKHRRTPRKSHASSSPDPIFQLMVRQRNIHSEEHLKRLRKSHAERRKALGFYKKGGKTRPITRAKKRRKIVRKKVKIDSRGSWVAITQEEADAIRERGLDLVADEIFSRLGLSGVYISDYNLTHLRVFMRRPVVADAPVQVWRPSKPYDARWRSWITGLITKAGEDPTLVEIHIHSYGVDIIPKWAPGSVFDRENMKKYEGTMALIRAWWNPATARWELRDLIPIWVNPQDGYWETATDVNAGPRGAKTANVTLEELVRHNKHNARARG